MGIIETCINRIAFPVNFLTKIGSSPILILKYVTPGPSNPLYCILIWYIYTIYVSGKLGPGRYFKIKNNDDPIFFNF